ncbi:hypothetical protein L3Q82_015280 [Scortum barcoo]|uniref:Uncharacterized protein n=1 Tax=Scortum barcoo TaxID=214431 RepID=A0ACB8VUL8_9TELE|nr:hypothetical protein L3Q82_015280 [Scortum barcoo]
MLTKIDYHIWKITSLRFSLSWLKKYLTFGKSSLLRTDLPSVSLLQKSPSSPVSCHHATGFYPDRATLIWRKDGEELHEDVDHGEILPNHDGSFQMSVDLKLSSVTPEDWSRYDCVFHLSGVKDDIVTKLDKAEIRTNWGKNESEQKRRGACPESLEATVQKLQPSNMIIPIIAAVAVLAVVLMAAAGFILYKKKNPPRGLEGLWEFAQPVPVFVDLEALQAKSPPHGSSVHNVVFDAVLVFVDVLHGFLQQTESISFLMSDEDVCGVKDDIITKLDKAEIRTNLGKTGIRDDKEEPSNITVLITAAVVVLALIIIIIISVIGFIFYKKEESPSSSTS